MDAVAMAPGAGQLEPKQVEAQTAGSASAESETEARKRTKRQLAMIRRMASWSSQLIVVGVASAFLYAHVHDGMSLDNVDLILLVVALVPFLLLGIGESFGSFEVFGVKFELVRRTVQRQGRLIEEMLEALSHTLTIYEHGHLRNLSHHTAKGYHWNEYLYAEVVRLCQHGFARETVKGIVQQLLHWIPDFDLETFCVITPEGKKHLELVEKAQKRARTLLIPGR